MAKLIDKLWNWGHLEGSYKECTLLDCNMTPEEFAEEYGIARSFIISYGGNIQAPFEPYAKRFSTLKEVKWSVLGDCSSPLPEAELGNTDDILACLNVDGVDNITGGMVDDFFSPERMEKYPPEVLMKIRKKLNAQGLDFWCVLYNHQLDFDLTEYLKCFDGVSFWIWGCEKINEMEEYLEKFFKLAKNNKKMLGVYVWDFMDVGKQPMDSVLYEKQLRRYFNLVADNTVDGLIVCSSVLGDVDLETNRILKRYIAEYGNLEVEEK
ncbi:MAG: hypothetical protein IJB97_02675 [Clostridia bacterium]|nr:hypothetical protein [Clostridia bacterium]